MVKYNRCLKLLEDGFSVITVGESKIPNFPWKPFQKKQMPLPEFEKRYNYKGGIFYNKKLAGGKTEKVEIPATGHVGIATGYDYLECLDVDLKVFSTAKEQKKWWTEYLGYLEDNILDFHDKFVIAKTKNAGFHILYKTKRVEGNKKIASLKGHTQAILETRGVGGYVFIYDKFLNDKTYADIDFISDEYRDILFGCSAHYNYINPVKIDPPKRDKKQYQVSAGDITPWDDFNAKNNVWDIVSSEFTIVRNLDKKYIIKRHSSESPHSGYIYKDDGLMYLFSTGTIYDAQKQYSAFSAYARKHFGDNFSEAAKQAYQDGYGTRHVKKQDEPKENIVLNKTDLVFPIDVFPEAIQSYITECSNTLSSSIDYMGCSLLWVISLCIGNSMRVEIKRGWQEIPSVWIAVVGKPGIGKTPSIGNIITPLEKQNNRKISKFIKEYEKYQVYEALSAKEKKENPEVKKPVKEQFIANDITLEALVQLHQENDNGIGVFKDELAGWFKDMNKYKPGSDLEFWLSSWSGKAVNVNRITRAGSFVPNPMIPVLGGIQPGILNAFYTEENKNNGFMDRILLSYPDLKVEDFNEKELKQETINWFQDCIVSLQDRVLTHVVKRDYDGEIIPEVYRFSPDAMKVWKRFHKEVTKVENCPNENEYMKSMLPKHKAYMARFSLLIHAFRMHFGLEEDDGLISETSILQAYKLSKYFIAMSKKVRIDSNEVSAIKKVIKANDNKTNKDKFEIMYKDNPDVNKKEASELLGVSLQMIYKYIKQIEE